MDIFPCQRAHAEQRRSEGERRAGDDGVRVIATAKTADKVFSSDALPAVFPFTDHATVNYPHTCAIVDDNGTLLLQLSSITQKQRGQTGFVVPKSQVWRMVALQRR